MLRFFRSIRQRLFLEGKVSRYLGYAFGEIVLIVVGILIALQIQNWNEGRKERELEMVVLRQLRGDILENIELLNRTLDKHIVSRDATVSLLMLFSKPKVMATAEDIDALIEKCTRPETFHPQLGFIKSIISTGEVKYVKDQDIIKFVTSIEEKIEESTYNYRRLIEGWDDGLHPRQHPYVRWMSIAGRLDSEWFQVEWPESKFEADYEGLFNDPILENMYMITAYDQTASVELEEALIAYMTSTLTLVDERLASLEK